MRYDKKVVHCWGSVWGAGPALNSCFSRISGHLDLHSVAVRWWAFRDVISSLWASCSSSRTRGIPAWPARIRPYPSDGSIVDQRLLRGPSFEPTLTQRITYDAMLYDGNYASSYSSFLSSGQSAMMLLSSNPMLVGCWANAADVGPTFDQHWGNFSCLLLAGILSCYNFLYYIWMLGQRRRRWTNIRPILG